MRQGSATTLTSTVDPADIARFERIAREWWDPNGRFRPLHRMNPTRIAYIRDRICEALGRDGQQARPLRGLDLVDVGCGGGLLCEPMTRLGATVTGIDASTEAIAVARTHAAEHGLAIDYRQTTAEALVDAGARFDVVLALEVVEHVADREAFVRALADLLQPGGVLVMSTLNRTAKSFAVAIVGAEYVLRWLTPGTHDWRQFVRPSVLAAAVRRHGLAVQDVCGLVFDPLRATWRLDTHDLAVNYLLCAVKSA